MNNPVIVPIWLVILLAIAPYIAITAVPYIQELRRDGAVTNINDHATVEHNKLGDLIVKSVTEGFNLKYNEHVFQNNQIAEIKNNTEMLLNGSR